MGRIMKNNYQFKGFLSALKERGCNLDDPEFSNYFNDMLIKEMEAYRAKEAYEKMYDIDYALAQIKRCKDVSTDRNE